MADAIWPPPSKFTPRLLSASHACSTRRAARSRITATGRSAWGTQCCPSSPTTRAPCSYQALASPAGGDWRLALWPTVGAECLMAAADLFDDAADADTGDNAGVLLTAAAGLLSLAS